MNKLEKQLANALWRTWCMLPASLHEVVTDDRGDHPQAKVVKVHAASMRALRAASRGGWEEPS